MGGGLGGLHFSPISSENITKTSNGYQIKIDNLHIVVPTGYSDGSSLTYDGNGTIDIEGEGSTCTYHQYWQPFFINTC